MNPMHPASPRLALGIKFTQKPKPGYAEASPWQRHPRFLPFGYDSSSFRIPLMKPMPKTVVVLGVVSLLTDASSEMIYPLLPLFLTQVLWAGPMAIGIIEGVAESTASMLKLVSGIWADRLRRRKPLIVLGYGLSGFFRPFIGLAT